MLYLSKLFQRRLIDCQKFVVAQVESDARAKRIREHNAMRSCTIVPSARRRAPRFYHLASPAEARHGTSCGHFRDSLEVAENPPVRAVALLRQSDIYQLSRPHVMIDASLAPTSRL